MEDVQYAYDRFLQREDRLLHAFHDFHGPHVRRMMATNEAEFEDDDRRVHHQSIDKYHDQHAAQDACIAHDQVQARPEHDGKASDIADPADLTDDGGEDGWACVCELFDEVAGGLEDDAEGSDDDGPEVKSGVPLKCYVNEHEELDAHPVCYCAE